MTTTPNESVENTIPVLAVSDVPASIRFYCERLGFKRDWGGEGNTPQIASVSRDGHAIMLQYRDSLAPSCVWIGVSGFVSLWGKFRSSGNEEVVQRPTNQPWALEMKIKDPDGNLLWFGTDPLTGVPFGQEPEYSEIHE